MPVQTFPQFVADMLAALPDDFICGTDAEDDAQMLDFILGMEPWAKASAPIMEGSIAERKLRIRIGNEVILSATRDDHPDLADLDDKGDPDEPPLPPYWYLEFRASAFQA